MRLFVLLATLVALAAPVAANISPDGRLLVDGYDGPGGAGCVPMGCHDR